MKIKRKNKILLAIVIVLMLSVLLLIPQMAIAQEEVPTNPGAPSGNKVQPSLKVKPLDNPTCCDLGYCNYSLKIDPPSSGTYSDGELSVTITVTGKLVDWTSAIPVIPVNAVIVKGGPCANLFEYPGGSVGDTLLHAPVNPKTGEYYDISHINFCYSIGEPVCLKCDITEVDPICAGESVQLFATVTGGAPPLTYSWDDGGAEGKFNNSSIKDPIWTSPTKYTGTATLTLTVTDSEGCPTTCFVNVKVNPLPICFIARVDPICAGESVQLYAAVNGGTPGYKYSWDDEGVGGTFSDPNIKDPIWTPLSGFTGIATLTLTVTDSEGCPTTCFVDVTVNPCPPPPPPPPPCKCSLVVLKRDGAENAIDGAVFEVNGIQKTIAGGEARWDDLECDTTYKVKEISPNNYSKGIHLGDCGERSTMRVVNKIVVEEEGEEGYLEVLGIMEVLPFTGPAIPYSPFIGISTVLAGTFLYILSKPKKKR